MRRLDQQGQYDTFEGYASRTLYDPRTGQRTRSQLPEAQLGPAGQNYSYAQWRDIARNVNRGRPSVNRGRP
jgi:hypothetical protein